MNQISFFHQLSILLFGVITFHGADYNLIGISLIVVLNILKMPEREPCKVYDFMEYKAKRDAMKIKSSYQKAA